MGGSQAAVGQGAQALYRVEFLIAAAGDLVGVRREQQVAALGDQQKQQSVDQAQQLAQIVVAAQVAFPQSGAQGGVVAMGQKPLSQGFDGFFHPPPKAVQGAGAFRGGLVGPLLQEALLWWVALEAAAVGYQP